MKYLLILILCLISSCEQAKVDLTKQNSLAANQLFETYYQNFQSNLLHLYPQEMTVNLIHNKNDQLNDISAAIIQRLVNLSFNALKQIKLKINEDLLDSLNSDKLNQLDKKNKYFKLLNSYWYYRYTANPLFGEHLTISDFLINNHPLKSKKDVDNYLRRVIDMKRKFRSLLKRSQIQYEKGLFAPQFLVRKTIQQLDSILALKPESQSIYIRLKDEIGNINTIKNPNKILSDLLFYIESNMLKRLTRWRDFLANEFLKKAYTNLSILNIDSNLIYYDSLLKLYGSDRQVISSEEVLNMNISTLDSLKHYIFAELKFEPDNYYLKLNNGQKAKIRSLVSTNAKSSKNFFRWLQQLDHIAHIDKKSEEELIKKIYSTQLLTVQERSKLLVILALYPGYLSQFVTILD